MSRFQRAVLVLAAATASAAAVPHWAVAGTYRFERLGQDILPTAIDDAGQIAGDLPNNQVFVLSHGTYTAFSVADPGASGVHLGGLNVKGVAIGSYFSAAFVLSGFTYDLSTGKQTLLTVEHSRIVTPQAIARSGTIVGNGSDGKMFIITSSTARLIRGIAVKEAILVSSITNSGTIAGVYGPLHSGVAGFTYKNGAYTVITPPGADRVLSMGINETGEVFGTYFAGASVHGFTKVGSVYQKIDYPGAITTHVVGVSATGSVVGNFDSSGQPTAGFVYDQGNYIRIRVPGAIDTQVVAINGRGEMVGRYGDRSQNAYGFVARCPASQVPCTQ